jgi:ADP-L-glycero-D-manno-heptose 6-epimerase
MNITPTKKLTVITGADGFIGSYLINYLNNRGYSDIIAVDVFKDEFSLKNLYKFKIKELVHKDDFLDWLIHNRKNVDVIIHLGAISDTTVNDKDLLNEFNTEYTKQIWQYCSVFNLPLIYASSAATYGDGKNGYDDDHNKVKELKPLNLYGKSKNDFDIWALDQNATPLFWYGLKFFNVYGPFEQHKGKMASVVYHAYNQIKETGKMKLFKSYKDGIEDGYQKRDFIYVDDIAKIIEWLYSNKPENGIYNVGTGNARTFLDLVNATFKAMNIKPNIEFIDMPDVLKDKYQYFTEANMSKLLNAGYNNSFTDLEKGVLSYVNFLDKQNK